MHYGEHSHGIILNLDEWFKKCHLMLAYTKPFNACLYQAGMFIKSHIKIQNEPLKEAYSICTKVSFPDLLVRISLYTIGYF